MLIVGIGQAGCNIAKLFEQHEQYHVIQLDEGKGIKKCSSVEEYDQINQPLRAFYLFAVVVRYLVLHYAF